MHRQARQNSTAPIHLVGIGGSGMLPLAELLLKKGHAVTGSDRLLNNQPLEALSPPIQKRLNRLIHLGARIAPQDGTGVSKTTKRVVISTAIEESNPDVRAARKLAIPVLHRAEELKKHIDPTTLLAVSGTSGKSTTAALCAWVLKALGELDCFVGGAEILDNAVDGEGWSAVHVGQGRWSCLELDESDKSLLRFNPQHAVILNITRDHHSLEDNLDIFKEFAHNTSQPILLNEVDSGCQNLANDLPTHDYAWFAPPAAEQIEKTGTGIKFSFHGNHYELPLFGRHNAENAVAALSLIHAAIPNAPYDVCYGALKLFPGIRRRMQRHGRGAVPVFDDYAHNPEKIVAAIRALQERYERVCIIFQPHGYGPLRFHLDGFAQAFDEVLRSGDRLFLLPVYDAGGSADRSITTKQLTEKILHPQTIYVQTRRAILEILQTVCQPSDAILITGARDDTLAAFAEETANMVDKLV